MKLFQTHIKLYFCLLNSEINYRFKVGIKSVLDDLY